MGIALTWQHITTYLLLYLLSNLPAVIVAVHVHIHDESFTPDIVLRITAENYTQACHDRYSVLINGSSPGPELRLQEGRTTWIRVHNDMEVENVTMVVSYPTYPHILVYLHC